MCYRQWDYGSGSGRGVTYGESREQVEGKGENKYNSRVCSGLKGLLWVGYWGIGWRQYVQSALVRSIYVLADNGTVDVAYRGVLHHPPKASAIEYVIVTTSRQPRWADFLVTGNFNVNLVEPKGTTSVK